ncbi:MAG: hypothetical protein ACRDFS_10665, partial [Chloroflexota bacterium]
ETLSFSQQAARRVTLLRHLGESFSFTASLARLHRVTRIATETLSFLASPVRRIAFLRQTGESFSFTASAHSIMVTLVTITENLPSLLDTIGRLYRGSRQAVASFSLTDTTTRLLNLARTNVVSLTIASTVSATIVQLVEVLEFLPGLDDLATGSAGRIARLTESLSFSTTVRGIAGFVRGLAESLSISTSVSFRFSRVAALIEALPLSDLANRLIRVGRSRTEALSMVTTLRRKVSVVRRATEVLPALHDVVVGRLVVLVALIEALPGFSDLISRGRSIVIALGETFSFGDSPEDWARGLVENLPFGDSVRAGRRFVRRMLFWMPPTIDHLGAQTNYRRDIGDEQPDEDNP